MAIEFPTNANLVLSSKITSTHKNDMGNFLDATKHLIGAKPITTLVISSNAITPNEGIVKVDPGGGQTDLITINTTNLAAGRTLMITPLNTNGVNVKSTGNITTATGGDFLMNKTGHFLWLQLQGSTWVEIGRFYGNEAADHRAFLGLGDASTKTVGSTTVNVPLVSNIHGKQTIVIPAAAWEGDPSGFSTGVGASSVVDFGADSEPVLRVLSFPDAADRFAWFTLIMPKNWNLGTVDFRIHWRRGAGTGSAVRWDIVAGAYGDGDSLNASLGSTSQVTGTQATTDAHDVAELLAQTVQLTPGARDLVCLRIGRLGTDGADNLQTTAEFIALEMLYTTNALNDS